MHSTKTRRALLKKAVLLVVLASPMILAVQGVTSSPSPRREVVAGASSTESVPLVVTDKNFGAAPSTESVRFSVTDKRFGAVGDGIADDRIAIQAALDEAHRHGGGEVFLPAGTYRVTLQDKILGQPGLHRALTVYPNVVIRGASKDSVRVKLADAQGGFGAVFAAQTFGADVSNFELVNTTIDLNAQANPVLSADDVIQDQKVFSNSKIRCALWLATGDNITIQGNRFTDINGVWTVFVGGQTKRVQALVVADNTFDNVGGGDVDFDASTLYVETNGATNRIVNNRFVSRNSGDAGSVGLRSAIELHGDNLVVEGNDVRGFNTGINIGGGWRSNSVIVSNNRLRNVMSGVVLFTDTSRSETPTTVVLQHIGIRGNVMTIDVNGWQSTPLGKDAIYGGIVVQQEGVNDREMVDVAIAGNAIRFVNVGGPGHEQSDHYGNGIHFNRAWLGSNTNLTSKLRITDNEIANSPGAGILLNAPVTDGAISRNTVSNPGGGETSKSWVGWQSAVNVQNRLESFEVRNNRFSGTEMAAGLLAINDVIGDNVQSDNTVTGPAPAFIRGLGQGDWTTTQ
jgi:Pectate lyase superfamily protein